MKFASVLRTTILLCMLLITTRTLYAQEIAITMDDPNLEPTPLLTPEARDQNILDALQKHHVKAGLFVRGMYVDHPQGNNLLKRWNDAGHLIGNHTYSHISLNDITEEQYAADTLKLFLSITICLMHCSLMI